MIFLNPVLNSPTHFKSTKKSFKQEKLLSRLSIPKDEFVKTEKTQEKEPVISPKKINEINKALTDLVDDTNENTKQFIQARQDLISEKARAQNTAPNEIRGYNEAIYQTEGERIYYDRKCETDNYYLTTQVTNTPSISIKRRNPLIELFDVYDFRNDSVTLGYKKNFDKRIKTKTIAVFSPEKCSNPTLIFSQIIGKRAIIQNAKISKDRNTITADSITFFEADENGRVKTQTYKSARIIYSSENNLKLMAQDCIESEYENGNLETKKYYHNVSEFYRDKKQTIKSASYVVDYSEKQPVMKEDWTEYHMAYGKTKEEFKNPVTKI
ncbi:hypothetical protein IJ670_01260 [bacterium]|nr:hypothetical protein [bacterium]